MARPPGAYSDIAQYQTLTYWSPIAGPHMERVLDLVELGPGDTTLEVGCGRAELSVRLIERYGVHATALDRSRDALDQARAYAGARVPEGRLTLVHADINQFGPEPGWFAAIACIGGPRIGADLAESWAALLHWLRPGGYLIAGEGFWLREPAPAYLEATGIRAEDLRAHWQNAAIARDVGATLLYCSTASRAEWDHFEGVIMCNIERLGAAHARDPEVQAEVEKRRAFYHAQLRWGRDTMGFALYLMRKP